MGTVTAGCENGHEENDHSHRIESTDLEVIQGEKSQPVQAISQIRPEDNRESKSQSAPERRKVCIKF